MSLFCNIYNIYIEKSQINILYIHINEKCELN